MAACLITISGTSGEVRINYLNGVTPRYVDSSIGTLYLEDTYTSVTYTTLSGNAIASSGCFTITALPYTCYTIKWNKLILENYFIDAVLLDNEVLLVTQTEFTNAKESFATSVNVLNDSRIKITDYKADNSTLLSVTSHKFTYIARVIGTKIPWVRIKNNTSDGYLYVKGVVTLTCAPVGFTAIDICETVVLP